MDDLHFVTSQLTRLQTIGEQYRESVDAAATAKDYFIENQSSFENALALAVEHMQRDRQWGEFCWEFPLALKGADEFWLAPEQREVWWEKARTAAEFWGDDKALGHSLGALANLNSDMNRLDVARQLYEQRLVIAYRQNQTLATVKTLLNLGNSYLRNDELDEARRQLHQARCEARRHGIPREEARALGNLAVTTRRRGRTRVAIRMLRQRLLILDVCEDPTQRASTHGNLGRYLIDLKLFRDAEYHLRQSLALHVKAKNFVREGMALTAIADLHEAQDAIPDAILILQKACEIFEDNSQPSLAADCREEIERLKSLQ